MMGFLLRAQKMTWGGYLDARARKVQRQSSKKDKQSGMHAGIDLSYSIFINRNYR